ncbi:MAG TPA: sugar transferase [Candidatus Acidoferrales bacterium]|jgi:sugar transferase (PEP-CTERM system associated)|nr:sugar transferase [Candidatus Acidoferrales bacterium]
MNRLFKVFIPAGTLTLLVSEIILVTSAFIVATYIDLNVDPTVFLLDDGGMFKIVLVVISILVGLHFHDLYSEFYVKSRIVLFQQLCLVMGIAFVLQGLIAYVAPDMRVPIKVMIWGSGIAIAAIYSWRIFFSAVAINVVGRDRMLLVGGSPLLEDIGRHIAEHPHLGLEVAGYVDDQHETGDMVTGAKLLGPMSSLREIVRATQPRRVVVGMFERRNRMPVTELLELRFAGHIIEEVATTYERVCGRVSVKELRPSQLIFSGELGPRPQNLLIQRASNMAVAVIGLIVSFPITVLTALAVRVSSPGPILYRQVRVGLDGALFTVYKFRSMRADAEAATGAVWAAKDDPRVTPVGHFLRRLRFDELPQLYNVLKGEMSIVGPRPERPEFVKALSEQIPYYRQRHCVRPGITGWAQINYKYGDTFEDTIQKLEYDLYYIKNMSLSLDNYIIFHTLKAMLLSRGAQ